MSWDCVEIFGWLLFVLCLKADQMNVGKLTQATCASVNNWPNFPLRYIFSSKCDYVESVSILIRCYATAAVCSNVSQRLGRHPRADPEGVLPLPVQLTTFTHGVSTAGGLITSTGEIYRRRLSRYINDLLSCWCNRRETAARGKFVHHKKRSKGIQILSRLYKTEKFGVD